MFKKTLVILIAVMLTGLALAGCGSSDRSDDFRGVFTGPAGTVEFLPDKGIKVDLADEYVWMIMTAANNHATHEYNFVTKGNKVVPYSEAEYINIIKTSGDLIISNPCKVSPEQLVLYPDSVNEAVFTRTD